MREPIIPQFDLDTYLMWEERQRDRFELHHGFVVAFAGGTLDHDRIALNLRNAFDRLFPAPCRAFGSDLKVRADEANAFYPDAGVVCDELPGSTTLVASARVLAEVLSPRTRAYDLVEKRAAYRRIETVTAYLIVDTVSPRVELDRRDLDGRWSTTVSDGEPIMLGGGSLTFEEIYARSSLAPN
ncbi:MAG: Uma2 family endonuclease [Vulcanimicrobiaceae bacterium]